jgi:hypothetical protein
MLNSQPDHCRNQFQTPPKNGLRRIFMPGIYIAFSGAGFSVDFNPFPK